MEQELQSFRLNKCYLQVDKDKLPNNVSVITSRWIPCKQRKTDGTVRHKARLVARGFQDRQKNWASSDAPTASKVGVRLVLQQLAERQWKVYSWDFKAAFLQGMRLDRELFCVLPDGRVWKPLKPIYGLVSGPRSWYDRLTEVLVQEGFPQPLADAGVFVFRKNDRPTGCVAIHVDDTAGGSEESFHTAMKRVQDRLEIRSTEQDNFVFRGLRISTVTRPDDRFDLVVDGDDYSHGLEEINMSRSGTARKSCHRPHGIVTDHG
eukprot:Plantae.Rhodophyta-Rhodochaete_pulchella.ctg3483.p1 GENE.Plantae.Rhodophyta-Rhodochaete_pulchella.ctg3483~~Plantae.Rhodophyta-Rhodochaete_pulchella.ctg3483.p1  ORF type:complete len:263 (-),score=18.88 Plantae.Rhodophyta-Rhodochaete_pulchella.ctg3483:705-1493(-)